MSSDGEVEVLAGRHGDLTWQVLVSGTDNDLMTHAARPLRRLAGRGVRLRWPAALPGTLVDEWRGRTDDWPYFVMARTDPSIERLVAVTDRGTEVELAMSEPVAEFALRFAAAALPDGEAPGRLLAWRDGAVVEDLATPMWPAF